jgi:hypothetical protein
MAVAVKQSSLAAGTDPILDSPVCGHLERSAPLNVRAITSHHCIGVKKVHWTRSALLLKERRSRMQPQSKYAAYGQCSGVAAIFWGAQSCSHV